MNEQSHRTPGYPFRYIGAEHLRHDAKQAVNRYEVDSDDTTGISVRTATPEDAKRMPPPENYEHH